MSSARTIAMSFTLLLMWLSVSAAARVQAAHTSPVGNVEAEMRKTIAASGAEVSVALRTLDGRDEVLIDPDRSFHAASTMKVPVMIELFRQARTGTLGLDDPLPIRNQFRSIVDGSPYALSEGDDSDKAIYAAVGRTLTLRELCEAMITASSNFAVESLDREAGRRQDPTDCCGPRRGRHARAPGRGGPEGVRQRPQQHDDRAWTPHRSSTSWRTAVLSTRWPTPRWLRSSSARSSTTAIPAGLPPGLVVAHKTGTITRIHHDAAIVYARRPYILVVLVRGIDDQKQSAVLISQLSRLAFEATQP